MNPSPATESTSIEAPPAGRFRWSASRLKRLLQCPRQFRYVYVELLPTVATAPLAFGRVIHEVVCAAHEAQMTGGTLPPQDEMLSNFDAKWEAILAAEEILFRPSHPSPERYVRQGHELLRVFHAQNQDAAPPLAVELAFEVEIGPHLVRGVIDRVDEVVGDGERKLIIVDYKSGTRKPNQSEANSDLQLTLYAQALEGWLDLPVGGVEFHALRDGTRLASTRSRHHFKWLQEVFAYSEGVRERGEYPPCPGFWCRWCDFQRNARTKVCLGPKEVRIMAYAVEVTLGTGNKVSLNYQSEEVSVSITYRLERGEENVLEVVEQKAPELVEAHRLAWERVREAKSPKAPAPRAKIEEEISLQEDSALETAAALPWDEAASDDWIETRDEDSVQGEESLTEKSIEGVQMEGVQTPITPAQVQVILALSRALELDEKAFETRLSPHAGETVLECLTQVQGAALIVEMSRERREQLDRERNGSRA